ncbi:MAG TPA: PIG-L family deacetylase [Niabella sp.]|nr:PIG-L family deacetylase [Niabella sp.]
MPNTNQLITEILAKKLRCVFISPHLDDAVLSCGGLMQELARKTELTVINVFTSAHSGPYTLSARKFLQASGDFSNAAELYQARIEEDQRALLKLGVNVTNLGLKDALFRRKPKESLFGKILPEFNHVYPTYKWHITGSVNKNDPALADLRKQLEKLNLKEAVVFAPYGIGNHVDHQLVSAVSRSLFKKLVLYSDFPYNIRLDDYGSENGMYRKIELTPNLKEKIKLIKFYQTQFTGLFSDGEVPGHKEVYFVKKVDGK